MCYLQRRKSQQKKTFARRQRGLKPKCTNRKGDLLDTKLKKKNVLCIFIHTLQVKCDPVSLACFQTSLSSYRLGINVKIVKKEKDFGICLEEKQNVFESKTMQTTRKLFNRFKEVNLTYLPTKA